MVSTRPGPRWPSSLARTWALLATAAWLSGCVGPQATQTEREAAPGMLESSLRYQKQYLLSVGDQLDIVVWRTPEVSRTVVVRSDGMISVPLLQDVKAAGLTAKELADDLTTRLSERLLKPQVTVVPTVVRLPTVYVLGEVGNPSAIPLRNATTALQAIAAAGGVRKAGAEADISVIRLTEDGHLRAIYLPIAVPSQAFLAAPGLPDGQPAPYLTLAAMPLQADDIVFVPEGGRSQVSRFLDDFVIKPLQVVLTYRLVKQY